MNENDFYNDVMPSKKKHKLSINKNVIIISLVVLFILIFACLYFFVFGGIKGKYSLQFDDSVVLYMDEPLDLPIEVKGYGKYMDDVSVSYATADESIVEVVSDDDGFYGSKGSFTLNPVSVGEDDVTIIAIYGVDKYSETLDTKTMHVVVCPKFDSNLLSSPTINIEKGRNSKLNLKFNNSVCMDYVMYSSENESIAYIQDDGTIFGITPGTTTINISNGVNSFNLVVNVID